MIIPDGSGFLKSLVQFGMVVGFWAGVAVAALTDIPVACVIGGLFTVACAALVALDVRKSWKEYRSK